MQLFMIIACESLQTDSFFFKLHVIKKPSRYELEYFFVRRWEGISI